MAIVYLVGAGPGDPGLITVRGRELLGRAEVVVYDYLACEALLGYAPKGAELLYVGKKAGEHTADQGTINQLLVDKARQGRMVVRLKGGDPFMFGRGGEEAEALVEAGVPFEVVPGVTSAIAAPAYAGIPLTHRGFASSVIFATGHEDPDKPESRHNWEAMARSGSTLVFFMGMKRLPDIATKLMAAGLAGETPAALVRWGTTAKHESLAATLETLAARAEEAGFSAPCIIVVGGVTGLREKLAWFEKRPLLGKTVVVTRAREQAAQSAALLAAAGAEVIEFPAVAITPLEDDGSIREAALDLGRYAWVVFTSVNGVACFWRAVREAGLDGRAFASCRVAAIGPATAGALEERGLFPDFIPETYVAEAVAEGLARRVPPGAAVLLPQGKKARPVLAESLKKAGARVTMLPVYDTLACEAGGEALAERLKKGTVDCVTFGSSSSVENFLAAVPPAVVQRSRARLACIGPITARTLETFGLDCHIRPEESTLPALVRALEEAFAHAPD